MYELLGISLMLTALMTINAFASLTVAGCWRLFAKQTRRWSATARAQILFLLRIGPPTVALVGVVAFLLPSYLAYESHSTREVVGKKLAVLALVSAVGISLAIWRALRSWFATRSLLQTWLIAAEPLRLSHITIPTFRIQHPFPIIAIVGTLRPRLFIAARVLDSLSGQEMIAAIAHECGHLAARDNFKRILIRACRDALTIIPCGRSLDRAWSENAEAAADEHAASQGSAVALNLASALIEIARMVPAGARPTMPLASFVLGDESDGVTIRVRRLVDLAGTISSRRSQSSKVASLIIRAFVLTSLGALVFALANSDILSTLHVAMEYVVTFLN